MVEYTMGQVDAIKAKYEAEIVRLEAAHQGTLRLLKEAMEWLPISEARKDATWVILKLKRPGGGLPDYFLVIAHWAHGGGDDQPAFGPGWFTDNGYSYVEVRGELLGWMPLPTDKDGGR